MNTEIEFIRSVFTSPMLPFILAVVLSVLSLILIVVFTAKVRLDWQINSWPTTPGKIESSQLHKAWVRQGTTHSHRNVEVYQPLIRYSYNVQGALLEGDTIGNRATYTEQNSWGPKRFVSRFPVGATVPVYYNPDSPAEAVLEKTLLVNAFGLFVGFGVAFLALCAAGFWIFDLIVGH